ncbi:MAG: PopZ family protein [Beijerinckiaceae bacterium]
MSAASPKSHEPSMEEILASIRRIIADDQPAAKTEPEPVVKADKPVLAAVAPPPADDDVLDLDDDPPAPPAPANAPVIDDEVVFQPRVVAEPARAFEPELAAPLAPPPPPEPPRAAVPAIDQGLLSAQAGIAVSSAFDHLAGTILAGSQRTLDDVVKDLLRPMLKVWLDDNLPTIVERLVRAEIERVARGGR